MCGRYIELVRLSGWWLTYSSEKYEFVSWDDEIPNIWKNKTCSKPPTSYVRLERETSLGGHDLVETFATLLRVQNIEIFSGWKESIILEQTYAIFSNIGLSHVVP